MTSKIGLKHIHAIAPYIGGRPISEVARDYGLDETKIVKLASNENPLGMPQSAQDAMIKAAADLGRYPDSNGFELKKLLSERLGIPADWVTLGNGSNDILELAARAVAQAGDEIIFSRHAFAVYPLATQAVGARSIEVAPTSLYGHDLPAMLSAIKASGDKAKLVFIANPNNPTGSYLTAKEIEDFLVAVPSNIVVVLDEAYNEYLTPEQRYDAIAWVKRFPNMILSRSFSKAYGLAGLRIGYGVAQAHVTDLLNRIRQPFNVNSLAQAAAIAAFQDTAFLQKGFELNRAGYQQLTQAFDKLNLSYLTSAGNFILVKVGDDDEAGNRINLALLKRGIIVRPVGNYGLPQWLRISIGLPEENAAFIDALGEILAQSKS
ncbi:histidinol-phosphate transaminase [Polynucleobacter sp. AP-Melu-500A-A1]|uniref:histidinol-phosphate transaminase n=1 Tax=Polynucleobacter sp. AP-Melu-500A-A1 TaxID=2576929 RepID=UPI001C0C95FE|nr:histidinol-phosphate transaminase [Polynucleobacter sp. AP-Melu-500A-A1]MBU3631128.1 histidinol-phosphate transaminase [Polynucleobacter sp. AP-Melu-500A-A1]